MMRLSFLLLAFVACAAAVPKLPVRAETVDLLTKQRDVLLLLQQVFQDIRDVELRKICVNYNIKDDLTKFHDQGVVKFLIRSVELRHIQRKGVPFTTSITKLRREVNVLTRVFLTAKDYITFIKVAAWVRCKFNEAQFVKAFVTAVLRRDDTRGIVLPALYEIFPYYYFDTRVIRKAQDIRALMMDKTVTKKDIEIPVDYTAWLPEGEHKLAYFTQDIGLASYYCMFSLAGWMMPYIGKHTDDIVGKTVDCDRCEIGRGAQFYFMHQQLLARYDLERLSNNLMPIKDLGITHMYTPFKPHLTFPNGLEFPGRVHNVDLVKEKEELFKNVLLMVERLKDAIDSGFTISTQGSILALYDRKGLDVLGNLIEGTGRSINPRYYGAFCGAARQLLGGGIYDKYYWETIPSALEISHTATRDPMFYKLFKHVIRLFKRYQDSLPMYKLEDVMLEGVKIESVKFDKLVTYCEKCKVDIDSATMLPLDTEKEHVKIKAVVDRLNHKPYKYEIIVNSEKAIKGAVVRMYIGPKYDYDGKYVRIEENRLRFVEMDQFLWDIKEGKTVILRRSGEAPMRSVDIMTTKDILHKVEGALNSHEPFYTGKIAEIYGFPERLALPKGKREGLTLQVVVIVSSPKMKTMTYGPVVSEKFQTYHRLDFEDLIEDWTTKKTWVRKDRHMGSGELTDDMFDSREKLALGVDNIRDIRDRKYYRTKRSDRFTDTRTDDVYDRDTRIHSDEDRLDSGSFEDRTVDTMDVRTNYLKDYYKDKKVWEMIGGFISLDGRPLGYPFDRPMTMECLWIPNLKVIDVKVFFEGKDCMKL